MSKCNDSVNKATKGKAKKALRMSYLFPIGFGFIIAAIDAYGIIKGTNCHAKTFLSTESGSLDLVSCMFDVFFSYIPSNIGSVMLFAIVQDYIYGIKVGLEESYKFLALILTLLYVLYYAITLVTVQTNAERIPFFIISVLYCMAVWHFCLSCNNNAEEQSNKDEAPDNDVFSGKT